MKNIEDLKIVKIGTLYFIPVNKSTRSMDFSDFNDAGPNYGQPQLINASGHDQFHDAGGDQHWVVVEIPAANNGNTRDSDDIVRELSTVTTYLFSKGLVPNLDFTSLVVGDPFSLIPQMA